MRHHATSTGYAAIAIVAVYTFSLPAVATGKVPIPEGRVAESALRHWATRKILPEYPAEAIRHHRTGVVVASLKISETGRMADVRVLEAPGPSIEAAVLGALSRWEFTPLTDGAGNPKRVAGKLTFYYVIRDGQGVVLNPEDAGYVGKWPSASSSTDSPVLDVRDRDVASADPLAGAIRMPLDEIEVRAPHELPRDAAINVYCADAAHQCLAGIQFLKMSGFERVGPIPSH